MSAKGGVEDPLTVAFETEMTGGRQLRRRSPALAAERIGDDLLDAVVITTGRDADRRVDGIAVIPAALLGP